MPPPVAISPGLQSWTRRPLLAPEAPDDVCGEKGRRVPPIELVRVGRLRAGPKERTHTKAVDQMRIASERYGPERRLLDLRAAHRVTLELLAGDRAIPDVLAIDLDGGVPAAAES